MDQDAHALLFTVYCVLQFALNYGPNLTTFVLPSEVFPPEVRSTFNGVSAAMGKVGALLGSAIFKPINNACGIVTVLVICAAISIIAAWVTHVTIRAEGPAAEGAGGLYSGQDVEQNESKAESGVDENPLLRAG